MNSGKAPGNDGISAEILQQGGGVISGLLHTIFHNVCEKCATPQLWRDAILVSLYTKGPKDICDNFRGISLLSSCWKNVFYGTATSTTISYCVKHSI